MTNIREVFEKTRAVRYIEEPTSSPCFRSVTRIWHFPNGDAFLELAERRDCLVPNVDSVDVPANTTNRVGAAVTLETATTVQVTDTTAGRTLTTFEEELTIG